MRTREHRGRGARLGAMGLVLLLTHIACGGAAAQTYSSGGSTAVIEQRGGTGASQSQVTVYPDGQRILSEDGHSTDLTIQRGPGGSRSSADGAELSAGVERLAPPLSEERFLPPRPQPKGTADWGQRPGLAQEAFRQRMLERLRMAPQP